MAEDPIAAVGDDKAIENLALREVTPPMDVAAMVTLLANGLCRHATGSIIDNFPLLSLISVPVSTSR